MFKTPILATLLTTAAVAFIPAAAHADTVTLRPVASWRMSNHTPFPGGYCIQSGTSVANPLPHTPGTSGMVGYDNHRSALNHCGGPVDFLYRTRPIFNIEQLANVKSATLSWHETVRAYRKTNRKPGNVAGARCSTRLQLGKYSPSTAGVFSSGIPFADTIGSGTPDGGRSVDVTRAVQEWIYGKRANFGFVLSGLEINAYDDAACVADVSQFRLTVTTWTS